MQTIRYHPLIDGDTDGREKVPMFLSTDRETIRQNSKLYLSEIIPNHYRLHSKESKSRRETDKMIIQVNSLSVVRRQLRQVIEKYDTNKLGLYICDRCRR